MAQVQIYVGRSSGLSGAGHQMLLTVDSTLDQDHQYENKLTNYPVEKGLDIADHVRQEPDILKIEGVVSDIVDVQGIPTLTGYAKKGYDAMLAIAGRTAINYSTEFPANEYPPTILVDIFARWRIFTDMICESFKPKITSSTGDALNFSASFKKVRKVNSKIATINYTSNTIYGPGGSDLTQDNLDAGTQAAQNASDSVKGVISDVSKYVGQLFTGDRDLAAGGALVE